MNKLKKVLKSKQISQSKVARLADIPQPSFNLIVNGKLSPCPSWRKRISEVLGESEKELFSDFK